MRCRKPLIVEPLEPRALLASVSYGLTTDQSVYTAGEPVQITLIETNEGNEPVTVDNTQLVFSVGKGIIFWESSASGNPTAVTLDSGQSDSQTVTWDGIPNDLSFDAGVNTWGTFTAQVGLGLFTDPLATTTFQTANPLTYSLTTDESAYTLGQPVQVTLNETNSSDQPVTFDPGCFFVIDNNGNQVSSLFLGWTTNPTTVTLQPGQSYTLTATWNDTPDFVVDGAALNSWGTFIVSITAANPGVEPVPASLQAPFSVADPDLVYSLTTDQSIYTLGEPVQITFTETNTGDQPATIDQLVSNDPVFQPVNIQHDGSWVLGGHGGDEFEGEPTITVQPGQSYSQTWVWDGNIDGQTSYSVPNPLGTYSVSFEGTSAQTSFQIIAAPSPSPPSSDPTPTPDPSTATGQTATTAHQGITVLDGPAGSRSSIRHTATRSVGRHERDRSAPGTHHSHTPPNQADVMRPRKDISTPLANRGGFLESAHTDIGVDTTSRVPVGPHRAGKLGGHHDRAGR
jgi:hypothetical protein